MTERDLVRTQLETDWVVDAGGRLVRARTDDERHRRAPLLAVATAGGDLVWAASAAVPHAVVAAIEAVLGSEPPPGPAGVGWRPASADRLRALLAEITPIGRTQRGPSYVVVDRPPVPDGVDLRCSADADAEAVRRLVPAPDRALAAPWVAAMVDGRVAAVCETARSAPTAVAAGVWTYPEHRRRGLATAVVAAWIGMTADRTTFYSTNDDNHASQGVARRLGLRPLAQWWQVDP